MSKKKGDCVIWSLVRSRLLWYNLGVFQIEDLVGYLRPYHVFPNVPPAGLDTLEDAFER